MRRLAHGGEVLAPGPLDAPMQVIDARDLAEWAVGLAEKTTSGTYNSVSPAPPFGFSDLLDAAQRAVAPAGTTLTWVDPDFLSERGETGQSLPLWTEGAYEYTLAADPKAAMSAGLTPRPLAATVSDTWEWIKAEQPPLVAGWGISTDRESELLAAWHAK